MARYLHHEPIALGLFNRNYCGSITATKSWEAELSNSEESLNLLTSRMECDYSALNPKMRRAYGAKDVETRYNTTIIIIHLYTT